MPPKKPLNAQTRNNTREEIKRRKLEEESVFVGRDQLDILPGWLIDETAKVEWERLVKELDKKSMISNLDYNNLGAYCNSFSYYLDATRDIKEYGAMNMKGVINPSVTLQLKYSDEMRRYAALLGLTVESRLKKGSNLLNNQEGEVGEEFGI